MIDHICFVQHNSDFIIVTSESFNASSEFVTDIQFVCVEKQNNSVDSFGEPLQDTGEIIPTIDALLLAGQDTRSVDN